MLPAYLTAETYSAVFLFTTFLPHIISLVTRAHRIRKSAFVQKLCSFFEGPLILPESYIELQVKIALFRKFEAVFDSNLHFQSACYSLRTIVLGSGAGICFVTLYHSRGACYATKKIPW